MNMAMDAANELFRTLGDATRRGLFERLAREGEAASLFGHVSRRCERHGFVHPDYRQCDIKDGSKHRMVGYHLINEEKLRTLEPDAIAELHSEGHLMPIFMALASLSNLPKLIAYKSRGDGNG